VPLLVVPILVALLVVALIPVSIVARIRRGAMRRQARGWAVTANLFAVTLSLILFLFGALVVSTWEPSVLSYTAGSFAAGCVLGLLGFALTRWERHDGRLHYTPNRWLVLTVTLIVTARVFYGFWRTYEAWRGSVDQMAWVAVSGLSTSMSAGSVVLGYYFVYWFAVRREMARFRRRAPAGRTRIDR
jgi:hypothetical protein